MTTWSGTYRSGLYRTVGAAAALALMAVSCGSDDPGSGTGDGPTVPPATATDLPTTSAAGSEPVGGWIGGEPNWLDDELAAPAAADADGGRAYGEAPVEDLAAEPAVAGEWIGDEPLPPDVEPPDQGPLRAGSVDDNVDYEGYLDYLDRIASLGIPLRDLDARHRAIVTVTTADGSPAAAVSVTASVGDTAVALRTTADGTVRFHPGFYGFAADATITYAVEGAETSATAGEDVSLVTTAVGLAATDPVPLDVLFLLDATGSMSDEIDRLKATIDLVAERVAALDPAPDVRLAMTLYRDEGDAFVTATHDFTADVQAFRSALAEVVATGGGDYAEALDEGLAEALAAPAWRPADQAIQLVFLVADAPPQIGRQVPTPYSDSVRAAIERGIKIFPVASSNTDDQAEAVFRQMAQATGAPFVFLSYGAGGAATGGSTDIRTTDYEELALDELVVRLIAEELNDLAGEGPPVTVPTTTAPPTTNPEGQ